MQPAIFTRRRPEGSGRFPFVCFASEIFWRFAPVCLHPEPLSARVMLAVFFKIA